VGGTLKLEKMFFLGRKNKSRLYHKIFLPILVSIIVTLLISSSILYMNFERIALEQVYAHDLDSLADTGRNVNIMTETAIALSQQIYYNSTIQRFMYYRSLDVSEIIPTTKELDTYRASFPFIDSIYVYNGATEMFYISSNIIKNAVQEKAEIQDTGIIDLINNYHDYPILKPIPRKINQTNGLESSSVYTFMNYDMLNKGKVADSAVIINFSESWIRDALTKAKITGSDTFILDAKGNLASTSNQYQIATVFRDAKLLKSIERSPAESDYSIYSVNGTKSLVTYSAPDSLGWRYIRITPYESITVKISNMKQTTLVFGASIILISFFIFFVMSRKLYKPIDRLELSHRSLENDKRDSFNTLKAEFLRNFISSQDIHPVALSQHFQSFGIRLDLTMSYRLILLKLDNYYDLCEQYNSRDRSLINYAIANISQELLLELYPVEAIEMRDDRIFIVMNVPDSSEDSSIDSLLPLLNRIQSSVESYLHVSVTIVISDVEDDFQRIASLYEQVMEASLYRLFHGRASILPVAGLLQRTSAEYVYPDHLEKKLTESLISGKLDEADKHFNEIIRETTDYPVSAIHMTITRLIFTLHNIMRNISLSTVTDTHTLYDALNRAETIKEIVDHFHELFKEIVQRIDEKKNSKHDDLILQINRFIEEDYTNPDLSINSISQTLDMSPVYVGRLYKQYTLCTIGDYITEVRINKAKSLLIENKLSIATIAEQIGFLNSSYFYKVFKKRTGVTPNEYKKNPI